MIRNLNDLPNEIVLCILFFLTTLYSVRTALVSEMVNPLVSHSLPEFYLPTLPAVQAAVRRPRSTLALRLSRPYFPTLFPAPQSILLLYRFLRSIRGNSPWRSAVRRWRI